MRELGMRPLASAPLALTMGEPGGVGGELAARAYEILCATGPVFFIVDDPARLEALGARTAVISQPRDAATAFSRGLPVLPLGRAVTGVLGVSSPETADAVVQSITAAVAFCLGGEAAGVVTNPIEKSALLAAGFPFPGHTEFLGALTASAPMRAGRRRGPIMMLAAPDLKTVPVTVHAPLVDAARALTTEAIVEAGRIVAEALRFDFGISAPHLAVSGLNPHAGEKGALGREDAEIIAPAVAALNALGVAARGPLPADTMFHAEARQTYDAALCMFHDQALIPVKTLAFHEAVNVTLGLPIIRTSPDHGTALDIAGKGVARPDSLIAALRLAAELSARRVS